MGRQILIDEDNTLKFKYDSEVPFYPNLTQERLEAIAREEIAREIAKALPLVINRKLTGNGAFRIRTEFTLIKQDQWTKKLQ